MEDEALSGAEEFLDTSFSTEPWRKTASYSLRFRKELVASWAYMIVDAGIDVLLPLLTMYAIDTFIVEREMGSFPMFVLLYVVMILVQGMALLLFIRAAGRVEAGFIYDIRKKAFAKLQSLSLAYYDRTPVGWIMARTTSDVQQIGDIVAWSLTSIMWTGSMIIILVGVMFALNAMLALLLLATIPPLFLISVLFQRRIIKAQRQVRQANSRITGAINEGIIGARTTKTLVREEGNLEDFRGLTGAMQGASVRAGLLAAMFLPSVTSLASVGMALVLVSGGHQVVAGGIGLGVLAVFLSYSLQMFQPIQQIVGIFSEMQAAQAAAERSFALLETEPEVQDGAEVLSRYGGIEEPLTQNWEQIRGEVEFRGVSFSYSGGEKPLLQDFNLVVPAGQKVALVGETGAGKSTLVNLVCRFYEPTEGCILIDGRDYRERSQGWLHANLGYVLQTPHLFSGSIRDNIRYSKPQASDQEVEEVARKVGAHGFISKMEKGYDTDVGEGGSRLSAGERQLISFARAILRDPRLFVLDEATSSIDTRTEAMIQEAVDEALCGRTSFIIAHRLSTIKNADRILVIHDGKIIEDGPHQDLLALKGHYHALYKSLSL